MMEMMKEKRSMVGACKSLLVGRDIDGRKDRSTDGPIDKRTDRRTHSTHSRLSVKIIRKKWEIRRT